MNDPDDETAILSESALAEGWSGREADKDWAHLADLPALEDEK